MTKRRVVITGVGLITPLGLSVKDTWDGIIAGRSGISKITRFDVSKFATKIAGMVKDKDGNPFVGENYIEPKDLKKMDNFIQYGIAAAQEAITDSGWVADSEHKQDRTGVLLGSGIGGLEAIEVAALQIHTGQKVSPFFIPSCIINLLSGHVSLKYGFKGPNHAVVTACATGAHAIGDASRLIKYGDADVMIAGGAEAPVNNLGIAGFSSVRALSTNNENPEQASRPWDKARDGFVLSEGAGVVVLEEYEHAMKRGAKIYAEIIGYGLAGDAYHITSTHPDGVGGLSAMKRALNDASISAKDIGYINAHGTSTQIGDPSELRAVQTLFLEENPDVKMSSTKSSIGHMIGAAGSAETIFTALALKHQILPPTLNLDDPMDEVRIDLVANRAKKHQFDYALTNSFGFGGTNVCLALKKI